MDVDYTVLISVAWIPTASMTDINHTPLRSMALLPSVLLARSEQWHCQAQLCLDATHMSAE